MSKKMQEARRKTMAFLEVVMIVALCLSCEAPSPVSEPEESPVVGETPAVVETPTSTPTVKVPSDAEKVVLLAKEDLAGRLGISTEEIRVEKVEKVEWPDASLGCPKPGMVYAQVITPGYKLVLFAKGRSYEYHTSMRHVVLCEEKPPIAQYDQDNSGFIEREEAIAVVKDYLIYGKINKELAIEVVKAYLLETPVSKVSADKKAEPEVMYALATRTTSVDLTIQYEDHKIKEYREYHDKNVYHDFEKSYCKVSDLTAELKAVDSTQQSKSHGRRTWVVVQCSFKSEILYKGEVQTGTISSSITLKSYNLKTTVDATKNPEYHTLLNSLAEFYVHFTVTELDENGKYIGHSGHYNVINKEIGGQGGTQGSPNKLYPASVSVNFKDNHTYVISMGIVARASSEALAQGVVELGHVDINIDNLIGEISSENLKSPTPSPLVKIEHGKIEVGKEAEFKAKFENIPKQILEERPSRISVSWEFGDKIYKSGRIVKHTFQKVREYQIKVRCSIDLPQDWEGSSPYLYKRYNNKVLEAITTVKPLAPDLTLQVEHPEEVWIGDSYVLSVTVKNSGQISTPQDKDIKVRVEKIYDGRENDDYNKVCDYNKVWMFKPLGGGEITSQSLKSFASRVALKYTITVTIDPNGEIAESDETNNMYEGIVKVKARPPSPPKISGPTTPIQINESAIFSFSSDDPQDLGIKYEIDWGDGSSTTTDYSAECKDVKVKKSWKEPRTYTVKARAVNEWFGSKSDWSTLDIKVVKLPDLIIQDVVVQPQEPVTGKEFSIKVTIKNIGKGSASEAYIALYTPEKTAYDTKMIKNINPGETRSVTFRYLKHGEPGTYKYSMLVYILGKGNEFNENNNSKGISVKVIGLPDLTIAEINVRRQPKDDREPYLFAYNVWGFIQNGGKAATSSFPSIALYVDGDLRIKFYVNEPIEGYVLFSEVLLFSPDSPSKKIKAVVDPDNEIRELNENNNEKSITISFPDLTVEEITWKNHHNDEEGDIWPYRKTTLIAKIKNIRASPARVLVSFYANGELIGKTYPNDFVPGEASIGWTPPKPGTYVIKVVVDEEGYIPDFNRKNNEGKRTLKTLLPDFVVVSPSDTIVVGGETPIITGPRVVGAGKEATFEVGVRNEGRVEATNIEYRWYIVEDGSEENIWGGGINLSSGERKTITLKWTPSVLGEIDLYFEVDPYNEFEEEQEDNNRAHIKVFVVQLPDLRPFPIGFSPPATAVYEEYEEELQIITQSPQSENVFPRPRGSEQTQIQLVRKVKQVKYWQILKGSEIEVKISILNQFAPFQNVNIDYQCYYYFSQDDGVGEGQGGGERGGQGVGQGRGPVTKITIGEGYIFPPQRGGGPGGGIGEGQGRGEERGGVGQGQFSAFYWGKDEVKTISFKWTPQHTGRFEIIFEIDTYNFVEEHSEGNNIIKTQVLVYSP
jgi:subtilase family serine protease